MATTTISINTAAYQLLKKLKGPGDSFSEVILKNVHPPATTCGELLDRLEQADVPRMDPVRRAALIAGRGRRSKRRERHARGHEFSDRSAR